MIKRLLLVIMLLGLVVCIPAQTPAKSTVGAGSALDYYGYGHRVIYEMNVGEFTPEGTFKAAGAQLDRLKKLGVDVVWLMPVYPRGVLNSIGSPYAAKDFSQVNPKYGTVADMRDFVSMAHSKNMEVWLDWVPNHTAMDNVWVSIHPDYYRHNPDGTLFHPYSGPIKYNDVVQLDYTNPSLAAAMTAMQEYWISMTGIDGLRCDFVGSQFMTRDYWHKALPQIKQHVSELTGKPVTMLGEADFLHAKHLYNAGWDYDYAWSWNDSLLAVGGGSDAKRLERACRELVSNPAYANLDRMLYLTNHDANHNDGKHTLTDKFGDNRYAFTVLYFTLYGMPLIYNSQEIGGEQDLNYFEDTKIDWTKRDEKMSHLLERLTALKHSSNAIADGKTPQERGVTTFLETGNPEILAYTRENGGEKVLVILNLGKAKKVKLDASLKGQWTNWLTGETVTLKNKTNIPERDYLLLVK